MLDIDLAVSGVIFVFGPSLFCVGALGCFHFDAQKTRRKAVKFTHM